MFSRAILRPLALFPLLVVAGCGGPEGTSTSPATLWLRVSREPQPPTMAQLHTRYAQDLPSYDADTAATTVPSNTDWQRLTGLQVARLARVLVDQDCAHFLNRLRAAQAGSRFTSIGISATNVFTLGILAATAAAAPATAIVGAGIAAANVVTQGFDETVLMTQHADRIAVLVTARQTVLRDQWPNDAELSGADAVSRAAGLARGVEYARSCNYSGIRFVIDQALRDGTLQAQAAASAATLDEAALTSALAGIRALLGPDIPNITVPTAAQFRVAWSDPTRFANLSQPTRTSVQPLLDKARALSSDDSRRLAIYLGQAERSSTFRAAIDAVR